MKYLLITNNDTDGIGQTVINLFNNLKKQGQKVKLLTLHNYHKNKDIIKIKRSLILRLAYYPLNFIKKNLKELFWFNISSVNYKNIEKYILESDVIVIFTFQKIISTQILDEILMQKKLVFLRPLDMEIISGGCHFNEKCKKFINNCNNCPKIYLSKFHNIASNNLLKKKEIFNNYKPKVIVQNSFVKSIVKKSNLLKYSNPKIISVGVNHDRIRFYSKNYARKKLGLNVREKIILFATYNLSSYNKGGHLLINSLRIFEKKHLLNKNNFTKVNLLTIGNKNNFNFKSNNIKHENVGLVNQDEKLNLYYRAADVLVSPSIYDFGPHVVNEAIANDLPVISYKVGTARDVIKSGVNGYLIDCYNEKKFALAIKKIILNKKKFKNKILRDKIRDKRSAKFEAETFIKLSSKILK